MNNNFSYFLENNHIPGIIFRFKLRDRCTNHLSSSFDGNYKVRRVFLDISKKFDKIWHERNLYKVKCNKISTRFLRFY